jgi:hypothetical protein
VKRTAKKKNSIYTYLSSTKVLETGSDQDIAAAKKQYWKEYKAEWRKKQRQATREFTIVCNPTDAQIIVNAARQHKRSLQAFIKEACLANIRKHYLVPDITAINTIQQQLAMNYNSILQLFDENLVTYQTGTTLLRKITELEHTVLAQLHTPKTLEQWIADTIRSSPEYKDTIIALLQNL